MTHVVSADREQSQLIGPQTRILTLQNGIDSVDIIVRHVDGGQVRGGVIYVSAVIGRPSVIRSPGGPHFIVTDATNGDPVIPAFCAACDRAAALDTTLSDNIETAIWEKFIALVLYEHGNTA